MDFFELGDRTSLICADPNTTEVVKTTLRELGFKFHTAETPELAVERLRYTNYDCIVVHENFAAANSRKISRLAPDVRNVDGFVDDRRVVDDEIAATVMTMEVADIAEHKP